MFKKLMLWTGAILTSIMCLSGLLVFVTGIYGAFIVETEKVTMVDISINGLTVAIVSGFFTSILSGAAREE